MLSQVAKTDDSFENMDVDGYWETVGNSFSYEIAAFTIVANPCVHHIIFITQYTTP